MGKVNRHLEGKRSLSNYKRMHWVVCKIVRRKNLENFERALRIRGKDSKLRTFPKAKLCFVCAENYCCGRPYCTDPYSLYSKEEGMIFEAVCEHRNRGCFEHYLLEKGYVQQIEGTYFEEVFSGWVVQQYRLGTIFKVDFWRDCLGSVSGFLLAVNVILLLI
jgi:hypothetical protein